MSGPVAGDEPDVLCLDAAGPCEMPETVRYLEGPDARGVVVANFGLLFPAEGGAGWQFVCEEVYGSAAPDRVWMDPAGRLFAAGTRGLLRAADPSGCQWQSAEGDLASRPIVDLAFDDDAPGSVWALGLAPLALYRSTDGGARFSVVPGFGGGPASVDTFRAARLRMAPSDGRRLHVVAVGPEQVGQHFSSSDGGQTWTGPRALAVPTGTGAPSLLAIAPDDPQRLFILRVDAEGDELWHSTDDGRTLSRLLRLEPFELLSGLAFPIAASVGRPLELTVAGRAPIVVDDGPPARLYRSVDGGATWLPPIPSGARGPSFRCLHAMAGGLVACAAGEPGGEDFLIGTSRDQGRNWSPTVRLADLQGPRACARSACVSTEQWLCQRYGRCSPASPPPASVDAGELPTADGGSPPDHRPAPATPGSGSRGCSCGLGGPPPASPPSVPIALAGGLLLRRRRGGARASNR